MATYWELLSGLRPCGFYLGGEMVWVYLDLTAAETEIDIAPRPEFC